MNRRERLTISAVLLMAAACLLPAFARADAGEQDEAHWWNRYLTPGTGSAYQYPMLRAEFGEGAVDAETGFGIPAREIQYGRRKAQAVSFKSYGLRFVPYAEGGGASTDYLAHYSMSNGWVGSSACRRHPGHRSGGFLSSHGRQELLGRGAP